MPLLGKKVYSHKYLRRIHRRKIIESLPVTAVLSERNFRAECELVENNEDTNSSHENIDLSNEPHFITTEIYPPINNFDSSSQRTTYVPKAVPKSKNDIFINELRNISYSNNITQTALQQIMNLIRPQFPFLPESSRTLLGTPKTRKKIELNTGNMIYFGIEAGLVRKLQFETTNYPQEVIHLSLDCNIDGLPIFKSSKTQFWPILVRSTSLEDKSPFVVAIFCGTEKPDPLDMFLKNFIEEVKILKEEGFSYNNQLYRVNIRCFSCDAPARAMLKSISSHTSFSGCERCKHKAIKVNYKLFYPVTEKKFGKRKDKHFYSQKSSKHIKQDKSPLLALKLGLVSQFVLDPMHLIYLGVVRRLIKKYSLTGIRKFRLSKSTVQRLVDAESRKLKDYIPNDFGRKCRGFSDVDRWKATEYRLFVLYTGPVLMRDVLGEEQYSHFMLLHTAVFILSNKILTSHHLEVAEKALSDFVSQAAVLYGPEFVVYNVHSLLHVCDDVVLYGTLEEYSCFPFENCLGHMKRRIRSRKQPLSQICNRLKEESLIFTSEKAESPEYTAKGIQYTANDCNSFNCKFLITRKFKISTENPDNVVVVNRQICRIKTISFIAGEYKFVGIPFMYIQDLYEQPLRSSKLGIYFVRNYRNPVTFSISDISHKCLCFPLKNGFAIFPLLHQKE